MEFVGKGVSIIALSNRQKRIAEIVRLEGPITGEHIAQRLNVTRAALRSDLAILIMGGILDARPKVGYYYTGKNTLGMLMEEISNICVKDLQSVPIAIGNDKSAYEAIVTMFLEDVGSVFEYNHNNTSGSYNLRSVSGVKFKPDEPDIFPVVPRIPMNSYPWKIGGS